MSQIRTAFFITVFIGCIGLSLMGWSFNPKIQVNPPIKNSSEVNLPQNNPGNFTGMGSKSNDSSCSLSQRFPERILRWCVYIEKAANEFGLEADLIASIMLEESGGDSNAYSKDGAVGLLQVMPRDGLSAKFMCPNGPCFVRRPSISELQDPEFNIRYGSELLSGLVRSYGDLRDGLKAYGPVGVDYAYADTILSIRSSVD